LPNGNTGYVVFSGVVLQKHSNQLLLIFWWKYS